VTLKNLLMNNAVKTCDNTANPILSHSTDCQTQ